MAHAVKVSIAAEVEVLDEDPEPANENVPELL